MSMYLPGREGNQSGLFDVNNQAQKSSAKAGQVHPPAGLLREQGVPQPGPVGDGDESLDRNRAMRVKSRFV